MNAAKEQTSFFVVNNWTHIHLLSGRPGVVVDSNNGQVTMQDNTGRQEIFDQDRLHLTWAPLNSDSQGEQA
ncbi:hypothetical protein [Aeromonas sp. JL9]|uniref:hypothetical protein n=1 Tax=Aeromonas sp. JL9 TaxID=2950549 RepID=UPI00210CD0C7|nr:hypothetical protein [Aeromonas sp. JL9]MCQ4108054.1 hypothetical protein [Aeromonas sp. JL9]